MVARFFPHSQQTVAAGFLASKEEQPPKNDLRLGVCYKKRNHPTQVAPFIGDLLLRHLVEVRVQVIDLGQLGNDGLLLGSAQHDPRAPGHMTPQVSNGKMHEGGACQSFVPSKDMPTHTFSVRNVGPSRCHITCARKQAVCVRVVGGGQKQTRRHPLLQEEDVPHVGQRGVQRLLSLRHEADWLGDRVGSEEVLLCRTLWGGGGRHPHEPARPASPLWSVPQ